MTLLSANAAACSWLFIESIIFLSFTSLMVFAKVPKDFLGLNILAPLLPAAPNKAALCAPLFIRPLKFGVVLSFFNRLPLNKLLV